MAERGFEGRAIHATIATGDVLDVRRFRVNEGLGSLFEVEFTALCEQPSLDFEAIVGHEATFAIDTGRTLPGGDVRYWHGFCRSLRLAAVEPRGHSTYELCLVPRLWLATQRRNYRIFQRMSEPAIALNILRDEWEIEPEARIDAAAYPAREYRVQYGESDYAFLCRLLEGTGISFFFAHDEERSLLVLSDAPQHANPREPLPYHPTPPLDAGRPVVTDLSIGREVRPGRYTLGDHDFRRAPGEQLRTEACSSRPGVEQKLEQYHHVPGALLYETPEGDVRSAADDKGAFRVVERQANRLAERRLAAARADEQTCTFRTTAHDLAPGAVVCLLDHPHAELAADRRLLVTTSTFEGTAVGEWHHRCTARTTGTVFHPAIRTASPRVQGVQSATVVGPPGEEIHVDEFGRVRVHFHWDRDDGMDEHSSCWIPVSQPWAGSGFGAIDIPRVGQEVLVDFLNGDPDRPMVVGRVYTALQTPPYKLPDNKTRSGWRSNSSPGGGGYNEIMMDDAAGKELLSIQAQKDLHQTVKNNECAAVGNNQDVLIQNDATRTVGQNLQLMVGGHRATDVGANDLLRVGKRLVASITPPPAGDATSITMIDREIVLDTGAGASITLRGDEVIIHANRVRVLGEKELVHQVQEGDLQLLGGPVVKVNC